MADVYEVAEFLKQKGYAISDCMGIRRDSPICDKVVGILKETPEKRGILKKIWPKKRAAYLGMLVLNSNSRGAKENEKWVLETFGKKNTTELSSLRNELLEKYGIGIEMRLNAEKREELYPDEYGCG